MYAVGALLMFADLRGAGLNVQQTLRLTPIEDILARGIGNGGASVGWTPSKAADRPWADRRRGFVLPKPDAIAAPMTASRTTMRTICVEIPRRDAGVLVRFV